MDLDKAHLLWLIWGQVLDRLILYLAFNAQRKSQSPNKSHLNTFQALNNFQSQLWVPSLNYKPLRHLILHTSIHQCKIFFKAFFHSPPAALYENWTCFFCCGHTKPSVSSTARQAPASYDLHLGGAGHEFFASTSARGTERSPTTCITDKV